MQKNFGNVGTNPQNDAMTLCPHEIPNVCRWEPLASLAWNLARTPIIDCDVLAGSMASQSTFIAAVAFLETTCSKS